MQMIIHGKARGNGVIAPELAFNPSEVFTELEKRQIFVHEKISVL